jgi:hypothetical protein
LRPTKGFNSQRHFLLFTLQSTESRKMVIAIIQEAIYDFIWTGVEPYYDEFTYVFPTKGAPPALEKTGSSSHEGTNNGLKHRPTPTPTRF